ncbi:MAG: hypothetical protein QM688_04320 [Sphingomonas bacterium]
MTAEEGERWGFHNKLADDPLAEAIAQARQLADGPTFAHGITKTQLNTEWAVSLETAIEMEAQAQAICMATNDFRRALRPSLKSGRRNSRATDGRPDLPRLALFGHEHRRLATDLRAGAKPS